MQQDLLQQDLQRHREEDKGKVAMARRLRKETTMSLKWRVLIDSL